MVIDLKAYWDQVSRFSRYPEDKRADGYSLGLLAEAGEVCGVVDKHLRNRYDEAEMKRWLVDELGDCAWYCAGCLSFTGMIEDEMHVYPSDGIIGKGFSKWDLTDYGTRELVEFAWKLQQEIYMEGGEEMHWARKFLSMCASIATYAGTTLQDVLDQNVAKLEGRHGTPAP